MNSITRTLCTKYTNLTDNEITYIERYSEQLQALSNAERADVFIDCSTTSGKTAIVVCEAKPQSAPSAYVSNILGMLIRWKDEPAVERSFRLGLATTGVKAVLVPEDKKIMQTVEPIFLNNKLIAVLIYEKQCSSENQIKLTSHNKSDNNWENLSDIIYDAVILLDKTNTVYDCNASAEELYSELGYVNSLIGMSLSNIQLDVNFENHDDFTEVTYGNHTLLYRRVLTEHGSALVIRDITKLRQKEHELMMQQVAMRELRHRIKNNLQMLSGILKTQSLHVVNEAQVQRVLLESASRIMSITATLEGVTPIDQEHISLLQVLERIRNYTLQMLLSPTKQITIRITGDDIMVTGKTASDIALVVNELIQNAIKHAFPNENEGIITVDIEDCTPFPKVSVSDNGIGFDQTVVKSGKLGLNLVRSIISEKLTGEMKITSNNNGSCISFDFLKL